MKKLRYKKVCCYDNQRSIYRLFRVMWKAIDHRNWTVYYKLSFAFQIDFHAYWIGITTVKSLYDTTSFIGIGAPVYLRIHVKKSYGGRFT